MYWASGKKWSGNPLSVYPLAQNDRVQMSVLQQFATGKIIEERVVVPAAAVYSTPVAENNTPVQVVVAVVPPPPPESFLFLPGTVLLPQPNGGLYKPASSKKMPADKGVRSAKYR